MRGKKPVSVRKPAGLRLTAKDPEDVAEAGERLRGQIRIGRLEVVDEEDATLAADLLHAMGKPGERAKALLDLLDRQPERHAAPLAKAAFCALCSPRNDPMPAERADRGSMLPATWRQSACRAAT